MRWSFRASQVSRSAGTVGFSVAGIVTPFRVLREWLIAAGAGAVPLPAKPEGLLRGAGVGAAGRPAPRPRAARHVPSGSVATSTTAGSQAMAGQFGSTERRVALKRKNT